jgi:ABC-2 type transport system permease protein
MLRRIWAITQKEFIQLIRDRGTFIPFLLSPIMMLPLFAAAVHMDITHIPLVVADQSVSAASRAYLDAFTTSGSFDIVSEVSSQAGVVQAIDSGQASLGIVIPHDFAARLAQRQASVLLLVDGSDSFTTQSAANGAAAISAQYAVSLVRGQVSPLNAHVQILYNPDLQDLLFVVPGMIAFLMYGIALKLTAFSIVRERESGTIEALLVTPIRPMELMIGKTIPTLSLGVIDTFSGFIIGVFLLKVPFRGDLLLFMVLLSLFAFSSLGLGMAISSISNSQGQANQIATLMNMLAIFLSGFMFPAYAQPLLLRALGLVFPLTYVLPITNGIFIKGVGLNDLWPQTLALIVLTGVILFVGARFFRQRLD